jgi:diguanylate cyclase (GGDEF)-like protein
MEGDVMETNTIRFHFLVRLIGSLSIFVLICFSDYNDNLTLLHYVVGLYILIAFIVYKQWFFFKYSRPHIYIMFFDVMMITVAIALRGGIRSDFYLGYFLILAYATYVMSKRLLPVLSGWVVFIYVITCYIYSDPRVFSVGRLAIRISVLLATMLLLHYYNKLMSKSNSLLREATQVAMHDPLTGAYNRRVLENIDKILKRDNQKLYLALMDIDDFKEVNDVYGHPKGDEVLKTLSEIIKNQLNDQHIFIRYGGEEFLILYQTKEIFIVKQSLKQISQQLYNSHFSWLDKSKKITITVGVSSKESNEEIADAIEKADKCLYKGKNSGKNCIIMHDETLAKSSVY